MCNEAEAGRQISGVWLLCNDAEGGIAVDVNVVVLKDDPAPRKVGWVNSNSFEL